MNFWVLLGPDYAGKSTVLERLHEEYGWRVVSYDDRYLERYPLISDLRKAWIGDAFAWVGQRYSPELVLSVLHPIVLHLRDEIARAADHEHVIVDSYYYKLLAKCRLLGVEHQPTFDYWRTFPRPRAVLYVDVPPEAAWARTGQGRRVNAFEHHGAMGARRGFTRLQSELRTAALAEVGDVPVTIIEGTAGPDDVMTSVLSALGMVATS
jgi:thymidylate kinase